MAPDSKTEAGTQVDSKTPEESAKQPSADLSDAKPSTGCNEGANATDDIVEVSDEESTEHDPKGSYTTSADHGSEGSDAEPADMDPESSDAGTANDDAEAISLPELPELPDVPDICNLPLPVFEGIITRVICEFVDEEVTGLRHPDGINKRTIRNLLHTSKTVQHCTKYLLGEVLGFLLNVDSK